MGKKINPFLHRLGVVRDWKSKWFNANKYKEYLRNDIELRSFLNKNLKKAAVEDIIIERSSNSITVNIHSARPGIIIGRGGAGVEELKKEIIKRINEKTEVKVNIIEIRNYEMSASLVAQGIAEQIEKRMPFRRVLKQAIEKTMQNKKAQGIKVQVAGRLNGAEMARTEWLSEGKIPLQTIRADIDFAKYEADTTYGKVGVKVWIYKGEIFNNIEK
ncbi:MAG: 30S ribosomal protein S3 [Candidatus Pacebacteria bacterium]|nr:30S ribosomal protein S3 [Candidatus Paceibacterota bacterium]